MSLHVNLEKSKDESVSPFLFPEATVRNYKGQRKRKAGVSVRF